MIAFILLVVGGLNWLLVGLWDVNVVMKFLPSVEKWVYVLVGLAALYEVFTHGNRCKECKGGM